MVARTKHTSGPWKIWRGKHFWYIRGTDPNKPRQYGANKIRVALVHATTEEEEANALLIAAATEMYEALEATLIDRLDLPHLGLNDKCDAACVRCKVEAALRKARG